MHRSLGAGLVPVHVSSRAHSGLGQRCSGGVSGGGGCRLILVGSADVVLEAIDLHASTLDREQ